MFSKFLTCLLLIGMTMLAVSLVLAQSLQTPSLQPSFYSVIFNQLDLNKTFLVMEGGNKDLYVSQEDLESMHIDLNFYQGTPLLFQGTLYYSLDQFPELVYAINSEEMQVSINAPPNVMKKNQLQVAVGDKLTPTISNGAYLNYYLNSNFASIAQSSENNFLLDANLFNTYGIGSSGLLIQNIQGNRSQSDPGPTQFLRTYTNWIYTNPAEMTSLTLGDSFSSLSSWNQSVGFAGIQFASDFATQPSFITSPTPSAKGVATLPSTVQVFINNAQVSSQPVDPGPFTLNNIPVVNGDGTMRVVTTNILGEQQIVMLPYSSSTNLLKPGLGAYSFETGFLRKDIVSTSFTYGDAMVSGTYNLGLTDKFTLQTHGEGSQKVQALGVGGVYLLPMFGVFNAALAPSLNSRQRIGYLWSAGYKNNRIFGMNWGGNIQGATTKFSDLGYFDTVYLPPALQFQAYVAGQWRGATFTGSYTQQNNYSQTTDSFVNQYNQSSSGIDDFANINNNGGLGVQGTSGFISLSVSKPLNRHWLLTGIGLKSTKGIPNSIFSLNITYIFNDSSTITANGTHMKNYNQAQFNVTKPLPTNTGIGYSLQTSGNDSTAFGSEQFYLGRLSAHNTAGEYSIGVSRQYWMNTYQVQAGGSVGIVDKQIFLARPIHSSFALVEVGYPGVTVYGNNNEYGKTDAAGNLAVTTLAPYIPNTISINPADLPFNSTLPDPKQIIDPYQGAGVVARFNVRTQLGGLATLTDAQGNFINAGTTATRIPINNLEIPSLVGENGVVYLTGLHMGDNTIILDENDGGKCAFNITMTSSMMSTSNDPLHNIGTYVCKPIQIQ